MKHARWIIPATSSVEFPRIHADPLLHELLWRRGVHTTCAAGDFLDQRPRPAPTPEGLPNLELAIERVAEALTRAERVGVFGDYDADGITSTAVLTRALRSAAKSPDLVLATVPTREQGFGLNRQAIDAFADHGVTLLMTVDCGSGDTEHVSYARSIGLDVIALDHHQIPDGPAEGAIVVSAQLQGGDRYRDLSAVGVAYMVVGALARDGFHVGGVDDRPETCLLDLVALGTIADMVPVNGLNRALVRDGLNQIRNGAIPGIVELCRSAGVNTRTITAEQVSFKIAPRLNAAGRMGNPQLALDLMLEDDPVRAMQIAARMEALNERRRAESTRVLREAEVMISANPGMLDNRTLVLAGRSWPIGLLGPVAAQLVERYRRPVAVLTDDGATCHGSARSVPGFDMTAALKSSEALLTRFGGHGQASGLTLPSDNVSLLRGALDLAIEAAHLEIPFPPVVTIDAELPVSRVAMATVEAIQTLEPFGMGNEQPLLLIRGVEIRQWDAIGSDKTHLRFQLGVPGGVARGVGFGLADRSKELLRTRSVDLAAHLKIDHWNGQRRLDVDIKDFRPAT